ncbi:Tubulin-tyrosine_ligase_family [Leishmania braziliensis MHOM/BR/75/M2904]|uniref:Tubulin-tyrosine_ligase_family n=1 Tax=Leishmania braziliensis MHOM/BR/75/M2904 TaxID=420245 RepID=A0A3P3ZBC4_LEIBR|nr:Tubulin-tyrosine_ligase_family [Leishmania braziliensis MHOM/BR/75/M2904]
MIVVSFAFRSTCGPCPYTSLSCSVVPSRYRGHLALLHHLTHVQEKRHARMYHAQQGPPMSSTEGPGRKPPGGVVIDCRGTRYHVVRAAARMVGWTVYDTDSTDRVPAFFPDVPLEAVERVTAPLHAPQVIWVDKSVVSSRVGGLACYQRLNHYAAMNVIARKALLFRRLMQLLRLQTKEGAMSERRGCGAAVDCANCDQSPLERFLTLAVPASFSSLTDLGRLAAFQRELTVRTDPSSEPRPVFFIIKPNTGCEGKGIRLTTAPAEDLTEEERTDKRRECIVQLYVDRPLLMGGKKFDLRLYVLLLATVPQQLSRRLTVTSPAPSFSLPVPKPALSECRGGLTEVPRDVQGVELFVHQEGLVRLCAEPYAAPTEANCCNVWRHLTNYAVNKHSSLYVPAADGDGTEPHVDDRDFPRQPAAPVDQEGCNKQSLSALASLIDSLQGPGGWLSVRRRLDECIALTVLSGVEVLRRELIGAGGTRGYRADGRSCFELLGFDVMLREADLHPVLLEVNHSPSLFCDTAFDFAVKSTVLRDTFRLLETHIPPWGQHEGNPQKYEACMQGDTKVWMEEEADILVRGAAAEPFGFRRLLPHYSAGCSTGGAERTGDGEAIDDWLPAERAAQQRMVELSRRLP